MTEVATPISAVEPALGTSGHRLARAIAWTGAGKCVSQLFAWTSTLVVVRFLSPGEFGLLGLAVTYLGLVELISEFGIGTAIVALRDLTAKQISQLNTAAVVLGIAGTALSCFCAFPLASFFHAPELRALIPLMASTFLIAAFKSVPYALLQKDLRFGLISRIDATQSIVQALGNALLVVLGLRYWGIAFSGVFSAMVGAALFVRCRPVRLERPAFRVIYSSIVFGLRILVSRVSWYLYSNADFVVAGRLLGKVALGSYTVAWNLANLPGEKIVALVTSITPTFFASVQHDLEALRQRLTSLTEVLAVIMFPVTSGFALVAPIAIPLVCGPQWRAAIVPMQLLALYTFFRSVVALLPQVINVVGETRFGMWNSLATLAVLPISFVIASRWGVVGIASVWVLVYPFATIPLLRRTLHRINLPVSRYFQALKPSFISTAIMSASVYLVSIGLPSNISATQRLACEIATGVTVYSTCLASLFPGKIQRYLMMLKSFRASA